MQPTGRKRNKLLPSQADPKKLCTIFHYYATNGPEDFRKTSSPILQHYPKVPAVFNATKSDSALPLTNLRTVFSSAVTPNSLSIPGQTAGDIDKSNPIGTYANANHSCTFVTTNQVLPVVDIACNYNTYRYKTFEACLRSYYGDKYPPGDVVFNSMQLNLLDSHTNVPLGVDGLFDFAKGEDEPRLHTVHRALEIDYLNPLDHFVTKQLGVPATEERFTETDG